MAKYFACMPQQHSFISEAWVKFSIADFPLQMRRCIHDQLRLTAEVIQVSKCECSEGCLIGMQNFLNRKVSVASPVMAS